MTEITLSNAVKILGFSNDEEITEDKLKKNYKKLALKNHPDKGGTVVGFQEINNANQLLQEEIEKSGPFRMSQKEPMGEPSFSQETKQKAWTQTNEPKREPSFSQETKQKAWTQTNEPKREPSFSQETKQKAWTQTNEPKREPSFSQETKQKAWRQTNEPKREPSFSQQEPKYSKKTVRSTQSTYSSTSARKKIERLFSKYQQPKTTSRFERLENSENFLQDFSIIIIQHQILAQKQLLIQLLLIQIILNHQSLHNNNHELRTAILGYKK